jgi:hypothetical protein
MNLIRKFFCNNLQCFTREKGEREAKEKGRKERKKFCLPPSAFYAYI